MGKTSRHITHLRWFRILCSRTDQWLCRPLTHMHCHFLTSETEWTYRNAFGFVVVLCILYKRLNFGWRRKHRKKKLKLALSFRLSFYLYSITYIVYLTPSCERTKCVVSFLHGNESEIMFCSMPGCVSGCPCCVFTVHKNVVERYRLKRTQANKFNQSINRSVFCSFISARVALVHFYRSKNAFPSKM